MFGYRLLLKIEKWKHCNKIIFKCADSVARPSFKEKFTEIRTCKSHEQYMRPTQKMQTPNATYFQCNPNIQIVLYFLTIIEVLWLMYNKSYINKGLR